MAQAGYQNIPMELKICSANQTSSESEKSNRNTQFTSNATENQQPTRSSSKNSNLSKYSYSIEPADSIYSKGSSNSYRLSRPPPPSTPIDAINKLEVESASTASIPISIPYYYIATNSNSLDTVNLFGNPNKKGHQPKYSNTSHINSPIQAPKPIHSNIPKPNPQIQNKEIDAEIRDDAYFNQLPKRYSQFTSDQRNPFTNQKSDKISLSSISSTDPVKQSQNGSRKPSIRRNLDYRKSSTSSSAGAARSRKSIQNSNQTKYNSSSYSELDPLLRTSSGDISNSMGSQATIFSTRQELDQNNLHTRSRLKRSKTRARLYTTDSDSTLSRRKAIKFKDGSWIYRLKLRINKMINKFKQLKFRNFTASSKRTTTISSRTKKQRKLLRAKSMLRKKFLSNTNEPQPSIRDKISAPQNNPRLGLDKIETVNVVDDELKFLAGDPEDNLRISASEVKPKSSDKYSHLASYIDQQQNTYSQLERNRFGSTREAGDTSYFNDEGNMSPGEKQRRDQTGSLDPGRKPSVKSNNNTDVTSSSTPPMPPPHLQETFFQSLAANNSQSEVIELWKSYLSHVLSKRIQLRQEINLFRTFIANEPNHGHNAFEIYQDKSENNQTDKSENTNEKLDNLQLTNLNEHIKSRHLSSKEDSQISSQEPLNSGEYSSSAGSDNFTDTASDATSELIDVDSTTEKFQSKCLNRRSVLGDMLDYDSSDNDLMLSAAQSLSNDDNSESGASRLQAMSNSSFSYSPSFSGSMASDIGLNKRYGTISRKSTINSKNNENRPFSPMRRSQGIQLNLNSLNEV